MGCVGSKIPNDNIVIIGDYDYKYETVSNLSTTDTVSEITLIDNN